MTQKDYIRREDSEISYTRPRKKKLIPYRISRILVGLVVVFILIFIVFFYFISHHKPQKTILFRFNTQNISTEYSVPPKPKERWYYVNEFKSHQTDLLTPPQTFSDNNHKTPIRLKKEQHQFSKQMQSDMDDKVNELLNISEKHLKLNSNLNKISSNPLQRKKIMKESLNNQMLQCAAFRDVNQADTLRAQLALEGIDSQINLLDGWHRVVLGPYKAPSEINEILQKLKKIRTNRCISLNERG